MTEILYMGWPFAAVCIALIIGLVTIYGIRTTAWSEEVRCNPTVRPDLRIEHDSRD